jgi:hypothetical protein
MVGKVMLIAGCSNSAGSEIDGQLDSPYNRQHSYGNLLANKLGYKPINIAVGSYTNSAIARSVLEWFSEEYHNDLEVFVLIGWTNSSRIEAPFEFPTWHQDQNGKYCDWFSKSSNDFLQININFQGYTDREKDIQADYMRFTINRTEYLEIVSANLILQLQYFFKYKNVKYLMCDTIHMFSPENEKYLKFYKEAIDTQHYYTDPFYPKYVNLGYTNPKALYDHHGDEPHRLYAEELYHFLMEKQHDTTN